MFLKTFLHNEIWINLPKFLLRIQRFRCHCKFVVHAHPNSMRCVCIQISCTSCMLSFNVFRGVPPIYITGQIMTQCVRMLYSAWIIIARDLWPFINWHPLSKLLYGFMTHRLVGDVRNQTKTSNLFYFHLISVKYDTLLYNFCV